MNDSFSSPRFTSPPAVYDQRYMADLIRSLDALLQSLRSAGTVQAATVNISQLPTSATGLKSGDLYKDVSNNVKVVP